MQRRMASDWSVEGLPPISHWDPPEFPGVRRLCAIVSQIKNLEGCEIDRFRMRSPIGNCKILYLTAYSIHSFLLR